MRVRTTQIDEKIWSVKTFGSLRTSDNGREFVLSSCEPHVRTRIRRVFARVSQRAGEEIVIHVSPEVCRDLLWFMDRYPLDVSRQDRKILNEGQKKHKETEKHVRAIHEGRYEPPKVGLSLPLREYQQSATSLLDVRRGYLLADELGLGKTVSAIGGMASSGRLPVLVVTMTHLPSQWEREIRRFAPNLSVHILKSGKTYDLTKSGKPFPDVIVSNYHKLNGWAETLASHIRYVVFDEAQELRRSGSDKYSAARLLAEKADYRLGLSGTPIYNYGSEFWNIIEILSPGSLGSREEFLREWCTSSNRPGNEKLTDPKAFGAWLRREGLMLRRTRKDVGRELPPLSRIVESVPSDLEALDRIKGSAVELAKTILSVNPLARGEKFRAAEEFNMLMRQATGISKAPYVAQFVRLLIENGEKVVLYGWHREVYGLWTEQLMDLKPVLYTGSESPKQKEESKESFVSGESNILIVSLRAGAGLDGLQHVTSTVVFGELDWSPGVHEQCIGRVFRDGQNFPVMAYFLLADEGSDPVVADVLGLKKGQIEGVRDPDSEDVEDLTTDPDRIKRLAEEYLKSHGERHRG
ncbi:MAG: DEAD/DEAH box helicase [Leptospirales bacterium]